MLCFVQVDSGTLEGCFCVDDSQAVRNAWWWGGVGKHPGKRLRGPNLGQQV